MRSNRKPQQLSMKNTVYAAVFLIVFCITQNAYAGFIIRDVELESIIRKIANPVFKAANISPKNVKIYIVNNKTVNAYVSGGNNIFIHTGLLSVSKDPNLLLGVLAHETGHIAGRHLLRGSNEAKSSAFKATLGYALGLAAAAAGSPQAGVAIASGAQHVMQRQILKHTRNHEEAADQFALQTLDKLKISAKGLLSLLEILYTKELALYDEINPYTQTHPLSNQRIEHVSNHIKQSPKSFKVLDGKIARLYARAITKLDAFLMPYEKTLANHPKNKKDINSRYARAIAYYKIPDLTKSLKEINSLIDDFPNDPFLIELKGQILFENGKIDHAITHYKYASKLLPNTALLKIQLAVAQIASGKKSLLNNAINNLEQAVRQERYNAFAWRQLAIAYGKLGKIGFSNLALAEEALIKNNVDEARKFIQLAKKHIKPDSPAALRLKDVEDFIKRKK